MYWDFCYSVEENIVRSSELYKQTSWKFIFHFLIYLRYVGFGTEVCQKSYLGLYNVNLVWSACTARTCFDFLVTDKL
jgi:hypothetical protein